MSTPTDESPITADANLCWADISLAAILENYRSFRQHIAPDVEIYPAVKADAYGHGAVPVVKMLEQEGVKRFCVARVEEAVELRRNGIRSAILIFVPPLDPQALIAARYGFEMVICDHVHLAAIEKARLDTGKSIPTHIKVDVGMNRLGMPPENVLGFYRRCIERGVTVRGIMSHYPCADSPDSTLTLSMASRISDLQKQFEQEGITDLVFHTANSAAAMLYPETWFNAVRIGISLYGQLPDVNLEPNLPLAPAMSLFAKIIYIKDVPTGTPVSYCQTYRTQQPARLATLAIGYGDGYPRHASGLTEFLIHGKRAPQLGRVCMDQLIVDVTAIPEAAVGDTAMAFGVNAHGAIRIEDLADRIGTIGYELTTRIGKRVPRIYKSH